MLNERRGVVVVLTHRGHELEGPKSTSCTEEAHSRTLPAAHRAVAGDIAGGRHEAPAPHAHTEDVGLTLPPHSSSPSRGAP
jgi:hypothetical protein